MRQMSLQVDHQPDLSLSSRIQDRKSLNIQPAKGSLTEMILSDDSAIQPMQLLPMLAQCNSSNRWLMWLSPNRTLNKQWLESIGLGTAPVVHIDLCQDTQLALCERIMASANSHLIIEWQGDLTSEARKSLRQTAAQSGTHVVLVHSSL